MSVELNQSQWDLVIIGGGAAGFFSAIMAGEHASTPLNIAILEKSGQLLQKVKISGGGRCNVTHDCHEPKELIKHYPRGQKSLIGPFHHFGPSDTIQWFENRGVELKVEKDGRMFPITDNSQTIIDCLSNAADELGVQVFTKSGVSEIQQEGDLFTLTLDKGQILQSKKVIICTGGTRLTAGAKLVESLGHDLLPAVPSLFTFTINHDLITDLAGLSVNPVEVKIAGTKYENRGPLLITHWGVSGPGILKLSAFAARDLAEQEYQFDLKVNWCPDVDLNKLIQLKRQEWGKRAIASRSALASIPKRLWANMVQCAGITDKTTWSQLGKEETKALISIIQDCTLPVSGKSINKDEFVTCGGVNANEITLKTMESKLVPGIHFAGEVVNIDGVTGGFNFQNAWTSGYLAGRAAVV